MHEHHVICLCRGEETQILLPEFNELTTARHTFPFGHVILSTGWSYANTLLHVGMSAFIYFTGSD